MRITGITIYPLRIPFVDEFAHSLKHRDYSDSVIVKLTGSDGSIGYGEGIARPNVTGETTEAMIGQILYKLWPAAASVDYPRILDTGDPITYLSNISASISGISPPEGVIACHGALTAMETALTDIMLKSQKVSLGALLPPKKVSITYSGVITAGSIDNALLHAQQFINTGIKQLKLKVGEENDLEKVKAVRKLAGPGISIRLDANGKYNMQTAIDKISRMEEYDIACIEQPIPPGGVSELAHLSHCVNIPVMADESLVTAGDAEKLIEANACDYLNLRIAKCGGISNTLAIARLAARSGMKFQIGAQVGETAILSAAGRHLAAYLEDVDFVEGSYGKLLLHEDIGKENIHFGNGGKAPVLKGAGLGINVREEMLGKYSITAIHAGVSA